MSVSTTTAALCNLLRTAINTGQGSVVRVFDAPPETVAAGDLPAIFVSLTPGVKNTIAALSMGTERHDYQLSIYMLISQRIAGTLPNAYLLVPDWADALAIPIWASLQNNGDIMGWGLQPENLFEWRFEPNFQWGDGAFCAIICDIVASEVPIRTMQS